MKLINRKSWLFLLTFLVALLGVTATVSAKAISYKALRYGTNKTSIASGYFVKPATVSVKNHKYVVTMQIKTAKSLSSFPVAVNWVNGEKPKNVRKVKDRSGNSHYYYSFTTTNLHKRINAKLAIDVPKVYKAHHLISFKFNTAGLPKLSHHAATLSPKTSTSSSHTKKVASKTTKSASKRSPVKKQTATSLPKKTSNSTKQANRVKQTPSTHSTSQSTAPKKSANASSQAGSSASSASQKPVTKAAQSQTHKSESKPDHSKSRTPWIVGGVVAVVAVAGVGSWLIYRH